MRKAVFLLMALSALIMGGCGVSSFYRRVDSSIYSKDYGKADNIIEKEKIYGEKSKLLYYFDKGSILQMLGDYARSNEYLNEAEAVIDKLYTKSISSEATSFFTNDMSLPYEGEDFEKVLVNIMKALNFMYLGDFRAAQVEARKIDHKLNLFSDRYEGKSIYREDAFARYISAFAYEATGDINDAYIDYKKSYLAYKEYLKLYKTKIPKIVERDVLRTADALGFDEAIQSFTKEWGNVDYLRLRELRQYGEVLIIVYAGLAPYKVSQYISTTVYEEDDKKKIPYLIQVAFPEFRKRDYPVKDVEVIAEDKQYNGYVGEDIAEIAIKTLEHKNGFIMAKAVARAAAKFFASKKIRDKADHPLVNILTNVYSVASEQADIRSWRTLPARLYFVRFPLSAGRHQLRTRIHLAGGRIREETLNLEIKAKEKRVIPIYCF